MENDDSDDLVWTETVKVIEKPGQTPSPSPMSH